MDDQTNPLACTVSPVFLSILGSLDNIKFSHDFNDDFPLCQARLNVLRLRLSRWGVSIGILQPPSAAAAAAPTFRPSLGEAQEAEDLLSGLLADIQQVQYKSQAHLAQLQSMGATAARAHDASELPAVCAKMTTRVDKTMQRRIGNGGGGAAWTIFDRGSFDFVAGWTSETLGSVEQLFPATAETRRQLCVAEAEEVGGQPGQDKDAVEVLGLVAEELRVEVEQYRDEMLESVLWLVTAKSG